MAKTLQNGSPSIFTASDPAIASPASRTRSSVKRAVLARMRPMKLTSAPCPRNERVINHFMHPLCKWLCWSGIPQDMRGAHIRLKSQPEAWAARR